MSSPKSVGQAYRVPLSGAAVGVLVREFQLNSPGLNSKTAKRYFRGQRVKDASRFEVIEAVADGAGEGGVRAHVAIPGQAGMACR